jgi:four helix bundle protein
MITRMQLRRDEIDRMRDFRKLIAWQKAHRLSIAIHEAASQSRLRISPGLRSQLLRSAASVPANISEGSGSSTEAEFARYLDIAMKSAREVENHLITARDLECIELVRCDHLIADLDEVRRIVFCLARAVRRRGGLGNE